MYYSFFFWQLTKARKGRVTWQKGRGLIRTKGATWLKGRPSMCPMHWAWQNHASKAFCSWVDRWLTKGSYWWWGSAGLLVERVNWKGWVSRRGQLDDRRRVELQFFKVRECLAFLVFLLSRASPLTQPRWWLDLPNSKLTFPLFSRKVDSPSLFAFRNQNGPNLLWFSPFLTLIQTKDQGNYISSCPKTRIKKTTFLLLYCFWSKLKTSTQAFLSSLDSRMANQNLKPMEVCSCFFFFSGHPLRQPFARYSSCLL